MGKMLILYITLMKSWLFRCPIPVASSTRVGYLIEDFSDDIMS
jgi:hypothetical protein